MHRRRTIMVIVDEPVGQSPSIAVARAVQLALGLAKENAVMLCSTLRITAELPGLDLKTLDGPRLSLCAGLASLTIATRTAAGRLSHIRRGPLCVDLGQFSPSDFLAREPNGSSSDATEGPGEYLRLTNAALQRGDFFLCASEEDRLSWLGALGAAGRIRAGQYDADPKLRRLLDVAPLDHPAHVDGSLGKLPEPVRRYCESPWRNPRPRR